MVGASDSTIESKATDTVSLGIALAVFKWNEWNAKLTLQNNAKVNNKNTKSMILFMQLIKCLAVSCNNASVFRSDNYDTSFHTRFWYDF